MPRLPKAKEQVFLHNIIKTLVSRFGRDSVFNLRDIHSGGSGEGGRLLIAALRDLPESVVLEHLLELQQKGWVKIDFKSQPWTFQVRPLFQDLPDMITPNDILAEKTDYITNKLSEIYPECYEILKDAQKKLLTATSQQDFSGIGNLCVQYWEFFTDSLWNDYMKNVTKPPKDKTKQKISPIVGKYIKSKTTSKIFYSLGNLFESVSSQIQKLKHSSYDRTITLRDAKLAVLLTVILSEEILYYLNKTHKQ